MPTPERSTFTQILTASPIIEDRAVRTHRFVPENELNTMAGLSRRAVDNARRFSNPNFAGNQTLWVGIGNMEAAIREIGDDFNVHAHILVRVREEEKVVLDLHRNRSIDEFGNPVDYCDARTVIDYIQAYFTNERKAA